MKKNVKFIGVAAAALLAVAPVVASPVTASADTINLNNAASTTTTTSSNKYNPQFYFNGSALTNGAVVPTQISVKNGETISSIVDAINKSGVQIQSYNSSNQLVSDNISVDATYVTNELSKISGVKISGSGNNATVSGLPSSGFNLELNYGTGSSAINVYLPVSVDGNSVSTADVNAPIFNVKNGTTTTQDPKNLTFNIASGTTFNPTSFTTADGTKVEISAQQSKGSSNYATVTVTSNPVNTSEAGRFYTVTLTATNALGKTSTLSYQVMIVSSGAQTLNASAATYGIYGNNAVATGNTLASGTKIYVGTQTKTINNVSYTKISTTSKADADSSSSNLWIQTSALSAQATDTNTQTHRVMIDSKAYDKNGNATGNWYYYNTNITIVPTVVTINGKTYYKVANKNEYVRVTNITGTKRVLRHNAYVYRTSYKRTPGVRKYYKGETVTTYGAAFTFKSGKKFYRITGCSPSNKMYIKKANF